MKKLQDQLYAQTKVVIYFVFALLAIILYPILYLTCSDIWLDDFYTSLIIKLKEVEEEGKRNSFW